MMGTSVPQWRESLSYGNRVRHARAAVKRGIRRGEFNPLSVLQEPTPLMKRMKVRELLLAVPNLGPKSVDKALERSRISPSRRLEQLTPHNIETLDENLSSLNAWCVAIGPTHSVH